MNVVDKYIKGDKVIWLVVLLLSILSILAVYSSIVTLAYKYKDGDTFYYLFKHVVILVIGIVLMVLAHQIHFKYYSRLSQIALILSIPLLLLTLITGANINEASRWLVIPVINQTFQTSDLAKLALMMYLARFLYKNQDSVKTSTKSFYKVMFPVLAVCGLILPANFSTAAMLFVTSLIVMFVGGVNIKYIFSLVGIGVAMLVIMLAIAKFQPDLLPRADTWVKRIESFSSGSAEGNYQADQAKLLLLQVGHQKDLEEVHNVTFYPTLIQILSMR